MNIMVELALIFGVCLAGEGISAVLPFAFPASVKLSSLRCFCWGRCFSSKS